MNKKIILTITLRKASSMIGRQPVVIVVNDVGIVVIELVVVVMIGTINKK